MKFLQKKTVELFIVILAGGAGTRLWPMSTEDKPKQFHPLTGKKTMLQDTLDRVRSFGLENIYISTQSKYARLAQEQCPEIPENQFILESARRDTGPSLALCASILKKRNPHAVMAVVYADHLVQNPEMFVKALQQAYQWANSLQKMMILEVPAQAPNTQLGYVEIGEEMENIDGLARHRFIQFKEKPDPKSAELFLKKGNFLWNTGYYVFPLQKLSQAFEKHMPETWCQLQKIGKTLSAEEAYESCEKISIDYGLMEKLGPADLEIIPVPLDWSDVGTWSSLQEKLPNKDEHGNLIQGLVFAENCENCILYNESPQWMLAHGLNNMVMVQNKEGTLLAPIEGLDMKSLLAKIPSLTQESDEALNEENLKWIESWSGHPQQETRFIPKPWGYEIWFAHQKQYVGKKLFIRKGHRISLQYHEEKTETQFLSEGLCRFWIGPSEDQLKAILLKPGDKLDIFPGMIHRPEALTDIHIFEVSTDHLDDVVKLADDYGRQGKGNQLDLDRQLYHSERNNS